MLWEIALVIVVGILIWKILQPEEYKDVPGPSRWPILGNALSLIGLTHTEMFDKFMELNRIYGPRYMLKILGQYNLHVYDVKDVEIILSNTKNITKSQPYTFIETWLGTGLLLSTDSKWHKRRKVLTPAFHFDILKNFTKVFEEHSKGLVKEVKCAINNSSDVVDLMPLISDFTLYSICETAMGTVLNSNVSTLKLEYKTAVSGIGNIVLSRLLTFYLHNETIFKMLPIGRKYNQHLKTVHAFTNNVISERKKQVDGKEMVSNALTGEKRRLALLDLLLDAERRGEIDFEGIREEVDTFMFEGHDTTAVGISFGLMLLADHEEVQERILEEYYGILGSTDRAPTPADFGQMKYFEAVIKEILRLYPSVPAIGRRVDEDIDLGDLTLKKGCEITLHIYDLHRQAALYPDPDDFKPERFLSGENRHPFAYVPFSAGLRNCIGQRYAKLEMKYFISEVLRSFKLQLPQKGKRPRLKADIVIRTDEPLLVRFIPR